MSEDKKAQIKEAIRQLHSGVPPEQVKEKFGGVFEGTDALEIAKIEEELVKEGLKREEMRKLCDVHMAIFKEQIENQHLDLKASQPVNILMEEHKIMTKMSEELVTLANKLLRIKDIQYVKDDIHQVEHLISDFMDAEKHYQREENVLFPMMEKHGITEPPAVMWMEHDQIREQKKKLQAIIKDINPANFEKLKQELWDLAKELSSLLTSHFYKENNILFPAALSVITEQEWLEVRNEFDGIGYCCFTPPALANAPRAPQAQVSSPTGLMQFENGSLAKEHLDSLLNTLPIEITFIDKDDTVRYFNKPEKIIFVRTNAIIGRKVQNCHPPKSLGTVTRIVESFKSGKKKSAEFWIRLENHLIYIRFFSVLDKTGQYLGAMEVVQDVTDIQKLEGEKRLLDWKD